MSQAMLHRGQPRNYRNRTLDNQKSLLILKSEEDLKRVESSMYDFSLEENLAVLADKVKQKKWEIQIPIINKIQEQLSGKVVSEESYSTSNTEKNGQVDPSKSSQFVIPTYFIKFVDPVYEGYENFSFKEVNYEITEKDIKFIEFAQLKISHDDFEKVIDVFEKIVAQDGQQSLQHLQTTFYTKVGEDYSKRISTQMLETIYLKYWKCERENRKRSFLRMFWEKADFDDTDPFSAFRKRVKDKMKLRKKMKIEIDQFKRMLDIRRDSVLVLDILRMSYQRDSIKKSLNAIRQRDFELQVEGSSKNSAQKIGKQIDLERFMPPKVDDILPYHVNRARDLPAVFIPQQLPQVISQENSQSMSTRKHTELANSEKDNESSQILNHGKGPNLKKQESQGQLVGQTSVQISAVESQKKKGTKLGKAPMQQVAIDQKNSALCSLDTITVITKMLATIGEYGFRVDAGALAQESYSVKDVFLKTQTYFEQEEHMQEEEKRDDNKLKAELQKEMPYLIKRQVFIRRGRNNRVFIKAIMRDVFHADSQDEDELEELKLNRNPQEYLFRQKIKQRNRQKKRKVRYGNLFEYLRRESPESLPQMLRNVTPSYLSNKKILAKTYRKLASKSYAFFKDQMVSKEELEEEEEGVEVPELILQRTHKKLIDILEEELESEEEVNEKELEEVKRHHEKSFHLFKMHKTKGSGHGGTSLVQTQATSIILPTSAGTIAIPNTRPIAPTNLYTGMQTAQEQNMMRQAPAFSSMNQQRMTSTLLNQNGQAYPYAASSR